MDANNPPKENKNVAANTGSGTKNAQNEKRNNWLIPVFVIISFAVLHVSCLVAWAASVIYSLSACTCEATYYACTCDGKNYIIPICATVLAVAGMICCAVLISKFMIASKKEKEQVSEKMLDLFEKVYLNTKKDSNQDKKDVGKNKINNTGE